MKKNEENGKKKSEKVRKSEPVKVARKCEKKAGNYLKTVESDENLRKYNARKKKT